MAGAAGRARFGVPPGSGPLEELATVAGRIWSSASEQLPSDGGLAFGQLELSDPAMPRASPEVIADTGLWDHRALVQGTPFNRLVLDRWLCGGIGIPANFVGKHHLELFAVFILFVEIPR